MRTVNVSLGSRSYPIFIGGKILADLGGIARNCNWAGVA
jgi:hypothetical protein